MDGHEDAVDVEVVDRGVFSPLRASLQRGPEAEGGRGLPIMLALVDEVKFAKTAAGTRVRMRKRITPARHGRSAFGNGDSAFA